MTRMDSKACARAILDGIKRSGINFIATLPDINILDLIDSIEQDTEMIHVPLCREEEGVGICAGARLVGKKPALLMQNAGLLNSCNAIVTTALQLELPILLLVYYAGDIGDRGFARVGSATVPVLEALGVRHYILRAVEEVEWTFKNAWILAEDSNRPVAVLLTKDVLGKRI
ncbi:MAG: sulfopyruvate decarboxylase subunit alpha [Deltaproteobacteria bacterium]|nr:sulfopyruvate decarboxylase subunit alpha [Deltaproteobacteria bacterium]